MIKDWLAPNGLGLPLSSIVDSEWRSALLRVNGEFRPGRRQQVMTCAVVAALAIGSLLVAILSIKTSRRLGWTPYVKWHLADAGVLAVGTSYLLRGLRLRYVFDQGTVRAYNTWGLMWSEDLTAVTGVRYMRERSTPTIEISWGARKRRLMLFDSLRRELDGLVKTANPPSVEFSVQESSDDTRPSWICRGCREENPGTFEACWKCQRPRESAEPA